MVNEYIKKGTVKYWRAIASLFLGSFVAFGVECFVQPIIPVLAESFKLTPMTAGLTMSFATMGMALSMLLIAGFAKKLNRKYTMTVALLISSLLAICVSVSPDFQLILEIRAVQGFLLAGYPALALAYINEEFEPAVIGRVVGFYVAGITIGGLVGRLVISVLTDYVSWRVGIGSVGLIYVLISALFYFALPASQNKPADKKQSVPIWANIKETFTNTKLLGIYGIAFLIFGAFTCIYNYITYIFMAAPYNLSQTLIGFIFLMYVFGTIGSAVLGRMSDRYGNGRILCFGLMVMIVGVTLTLATSLIIKIFGLAILTFGFFGSHSAACSWAGKVASFKLKASALSLYMFFYYVGGSAIGAVGGIFLKNYGWTGIVLMVILLLIGALAVCFQLTFSQLLIYEQGNMANLKKAVQN